MKLIVKLRVYEWMLCKAIRYIKISPCEFVLGLSEFELSLSSLINTWFNLVSCSKIVDVVLFVIG